MPFHRRKLEINDEFRASVQKLIDDATAALNTKVDEALKQIDEKISGGVVGFPNYAAASQISDPTTLRTATSNGYLMIQNGWGNNYGMGPCRLTIGANTFIIGYNHNEGKHYSQGSTAGMFPVKQGESWKLDTRGSSYRVVYWVPCYTTGTGGSGGNDPSTGSGGLSFPDYSLGSDIMNDYISGWTARVDGWVYVRINRSGYIVCINGAEVTRGSESNSEMCCFVPIKAGQTVTIRKFSDNSIVATTKEPMIFYPLL